MIIGSREIGKEVGTKRCKGSKIGTVLGGNRAYMAPFDRSPGAGGDGNFRFSRWPVASFG